MVGVPGRSKGCNTCRQRRIRCSLERPMCSQCIKSNRLCTGYQRERIFVAHDFQSEDSRKSLVSRDPWRSVNSGPVGSKDTYLSLVPKGKDSPRASPDMALISLGHTVAPYSAFRQQLLSEFLYNYFPDIARTRLPEKNWLTMLPHLPPASKALEISMAAVCTSKLGRIHDDEVLIEESRKLYGQGLRELQKALWDPRLMYQDETLAACVALSIYEVLECPEENGNGWINHSNGCERLVQLRGPDAHTSELGYQLFRTCRFTILLNSLSQNRSSFLTDSEWLKRPWKGRSKSLYDQITDMFILGTKIIEDAHKLLDSGTENLVAIGQSLLVRCWTLDGELQEFYKKLDDSTLGPLYWAEFSTESNPADDEENGKVFPVALQFLDLRIAVTFVMYWTITLILWSGMVALYRIFGASGVDTSMLPPLGHRADIMAVCKNICQSFEYCMQDGMRSMGAGSMAFPLRVVVDNLKELPQYSRELEWTQAALVKVNKKGFRILKFVPEKK